MIGINVAEHLLFGLVAAVGGVDVPVPVARTPAEPSIERSNQVSRVYLLLEDAGTAFDEAAQDEI